jgi:hypothetical protein
MPEAAQHTGGLVEKQLAISLLIASKYLGTIAEGIQEHLRPLLLTYNAELGGVALSFHDVRPVSNLAKILYENPGIYCRVSATVLLCAPQVGDVLVGRINFVGHDHIGLTVYDTLKASISQSEFPASYTGTELGTELVVGREVVFAVRRLDNAADGLLVVTGSLKDNPKLGPTDAELLIPAVKEEEPEIVEQDAHQGLKPSKEFTRPAKKVKQIALPGLYGRLLECACVGTTHACSLCM